MSGKYICRNPLHAEYLNLCRVPLGLCIWNLGDGLLVDLEDVDGHAAGGGELLVADVALEVLGLLVLHEDLLVVELAVAVVAEHLLHALLLLPHPSHSHAHPLPLPPGPGPRARRARVSATAAEEGGGARAREFSVRFEIGRAHV